VFFFNIFCVLLDEMIQVRNNYFVGDAIDKMNYFEMKLRIIKMALPLFNSLGAKFGLRAWITCMMEQLELILDSI